ncbi:transposase [Prosthecobacter sp.]|uniref:transposase n=1 Tax=Prosthecobacter sp. TaxID=1965333 RepID=UPI0024883F15|nr:transposase [Prosthecobacter sp.]MDI1314132.1 transposase [Prosthecobacter sp.]
MPFKPFNPNEKVQRHRGNLPHWQQQGTTYFVTSRLADSLPADVLDHWRRLQKAWFDAHGISSVLRLDHLTEEQRHEYHREFTARFHELLDAGHGACPLADPACADVLIRKLVEGHGNAYHLDAWGIMPNHFHAIVEPAEGRELGDIMQRWKGGSAREINLARRTSGKLWHREAFDHIVRSEAQLNHFRRYMSMNPAKASLRGGYVLGVSAESGLSAGDVLERFGLQPK